MARKMKSDELQAIVARQINQALSSGDISAERSDLFDAYMAEPYGDEVENRSQVVSTDISDTVEWIMPDLMEIFTSGDKVVSFEPVGPDDEERAEQETDVVNHVFMKQNDGFLVLYSFLKDGLIQKNGYVKRWWDESEKITTEEYKGLDPADLLQLGQQWMEDGAEVEVLSSEKDESGISVEVKITQKTEQLRIAPVPPEELLIAPRWNSINLDGCPFVAHRKRETVSRLIEMGYKRSQVEDIGSVSDEEFGEERIGRFDQRGTEESSERDPADLSMTEVMFHESYILVDFDGDGIAELRKVCTAGSGHEILEYQGGGEANEAVECVPFSAWTPIIVPHRHFGRSIAEIIKDIQRIKTALMRNTLDNFYANNNPTREIAEDGIGQSTIEDLLIDRPGKIVRTALPGHYMEHTPPQFAPQALAVIEYIDTVRENRTGVSRLSQGLDANTINKTMGGQAQLMTQAQKKIALIARIAAETGVKDLFLGIHGDLRRNATKRMTLKLRGAWTPVNPRHWRDRTDVSANVALGVGNNEQQMQKLMMIAEKQEQNLLAGSPIVTPANLHHTYEKMIDVAGFKNPGAFFTDPATVQPPEPQPDPQMIQVQGLLEIEAQKVQAKAANDAAQMQLDMQKAQLEDAREREKLQQQALDAFAKKQQAEREFGLASAEMSKKIDLMNAQIDKIFAEIGQGGAKIQLEQRKIGLDGQKLALDGQISAQEIEHRRRESENKAKEVKSKAKPEPKPKAGKVKWAFTHDEKGRIVSAVEEDSE